MSQFDNARALPSAMEPEKSLLSSMLQDPVDRIGEAVEAGLHRDHFYLPAHGLLYELLLDHFEKQLPVELPALHQVLLDRKLLDKIGGPSILVELSSFAPSAAHFSHYLQVVRDKATLRSAIAACNDGIQDAFESPESADAYLDGLESKIFALKQDRDRKAEKTVKQLMGVALDNLRDLIENKKDLNDLATGYPVLDGMTGGLKPAEMMIVAARPSMGKTSFMMNVVEHVAVDQAKPTLVFSCEMSSEQLVQRLLFARSRLDLSTIQRGIRPTKGKLAEIKKASEEIANAPLFIDDTPSLAIGDLRAKARRLKREKDIQLIAVDYLQLMRSKTKQAADAREREIAEISAGLKAIAKELGIPVIVLAQLNRGPEQRGGTPRMSDLRESGAIEQDADYVSLLFRKEYYNDPTKDDAEEEREANQGLAQLIVAKNRNGPTGDVPLTFLKEIMRFEPRAFQPD